MLSRKQFTTIAKRVMADETPLPVLISIRQAWLLVSGLQLACRHPGISEHLRTNLDDITRQFQAAITERHPDAAAPLEMGWNSKHDQS